ncbi:MAG: carbohydrate ABC transporter permease [Lachnospiraceae bacterium]|nr:carbohydrate ABC transporter permease [Lachnospiraceae bacterium]
MKRKKTMQTALALAFVVFSCSLVLIPLYFTVLNSFKPYPEIAANIAAFPKSPTLANFKEAWKRLDFLRVLGNTLIVTVFSAVGIVVLSGMTGYWITRHQNRFTKLCFVLILCGMSVPFQCIMITFAKMIGLMNLGNKYIGVIMSNWVFSMPMSVFLVTGAVKALPVEIEESAVIDGCSPWNLYWRIVFPLTKGTMFTIVSLEVLKYWNNYLMTQFILTKPQLRTIQIAMMSLFNEALFSWDVAVAAVTLSILPLFIFFVIAQKQVLSSATVGAVKG